MGYSFQITCSGFPVGEITHVPFGPDTVKQYHPGSAVINPGTSPCVFSTQGLKILDLACEANMGEIFSPAFLIRNQFS